MAGFSPVAASHGLVPAGPLFLRSTGSRPTGSVTCGARAWLLHGTWPLPGPGIEPVCPALAGGFLNRWTTWSVPGPSVFARLPCGVEGRGRPEQATLRRAQWSLSAQGVVSRLCGHRPHSAASLMAASLVPSVPSSLERGLGFWLISDNSGASQSAVICPCLPHEPAGSWSPRPGCRSHQGPRRGWCLTQTPPRAAPA